MSRESWDSLMEIDAQNEKLDQVDRILRQKNTNLDAHEKELQKLEIQANIYFTQKQSHSFQYQDLRSIFEEYKRTVDKNGPLTEDQKLKIKNEFQQKVVEKLTQLNECTQAYDSLKSELEELENDLKKR